MPIDLQIEQYLEGEKTHSILADWNKGQTLKKKKKKERKTKKRQNVIGLNKKSCTEMRNNNVRKNMRCTIWASRGPNQVCNMIAPKFI